MADEPETEDETLELTETVDPEAHEPDDEQSQHEPGPDEEGAEESGEEETLVSFGDADPGEDQPDDNSTMRQMRARIRELEREKRERDAAAAPKKALRPKPTLEDHGYDEEAYDADKAAWDMEVAESQEADKRAEEENRIVQQEWQQDLQRFQEKKTALKMPDVEDCQAIVEEALNGIQQAVLVKAANDPALFMVALAKSPAKLAELAKMKDVIKLGAAIARMEGGIKVVTKRKAPNLDVPQRGAAKMPGADEADKQLAKLEKEADASGDRTKLIQYRKQLAAKGK